MLQRGDVCAFHTTVAQVWIWRQNEAKLRLRNPAWWWRREWRRLFASEFPDGDAEALRLVGEVVLDSGCLGNAMTPLGGNSSSMASLRLNGRCLGVPRPVRLESNLRHLPGGRPFEGNPSSAPFGEHACMRTMSGCLAWTLSRRFQIKLWSLKSRPPVTAIFGPAGTMTSVSARRLAAMKSRESISAAVRVR